MSTDEENLLLLHWSGELLAEETAQVEALLESSAEAREFFANFSRQAELVGEGSSEFVAPKGLAAKSVQRLEAEDDNKVVAFPIYRVVTVAAAAAVIVLATVFFSSPTKSPEPNFAGRREAIGRKIATLEADVAAFQRTSGFSRRRT